MEKISSIMEQLKNQNTKAENELLNDFILEEVCIVCLKRFSYKTNDYHKRKNICSDKCQNKFYEETIKKIIPPKYWEIETDKAEIESVYSKSVFITGQVRRGKTVFIASLAKKHIKNNTPVKWISYPEFIMKLQSAYKKDKESPFDMAEEMAKFKGVLVIDDLGAEKLTDFVRQITYFIINHREQYLLTTLITSNFSLAEIDIMLDVRISSRIAGMCECLKFAGPERGVNK